MGTQKIIDQHFTGHFQIQAYHESHSQLLIRKSFLVEDRYQNLDLTFFGTHYYELPNWWEDMHLLNGSDEDWSYIQQRFEMGADRSFHQLYKIISNGKPYFILAFYFTMHSNDLLPGESSIAMHREAFQARDVRIAELEQQLAIYKNIVLTWKGEASQLGDV